jgi:hypothetical protein
MARAAHAYRLACGFTNRIVAVDIYSTGNSFDPANH